MRATIDWQTANFVTYVPDHAQEGTDYSAVFNTITIGFVETEFDRKLTDKEKSDIIAQAAFFKYLRELEKQREEENRQENNDRAPSYDLF